MDRLTKFDRHGHIYLRKPYSVFEAVERLAAYEDIDLTPKELKQIFPTKLGVEEARERAERAREIYDEWYEYKKAEAEGRLIVLPVKVGGELWVNDQDGKPRRMILDAPDIRCHCANEDNLCMVTCDNPRFGFCAFRLKNDGGSLGKTVFTSREAAEAALKEAQG